MTNFPQAYKSLNTNEVVSGDYKIIPIRFQDRALIMKWRNEQIYHLRQAEPLTTEMQDKYFDTEVRLLFTEKNPVQYLFSYMKNNECIGYGGLVHINRIDGHAEISFIMDTELEAEYFERLWVQYLALIEKIGFNEMRLHKLYVYAFDLRSHLYVALEKAGYFLDARLNDHCFVQGEYKDVVIHSKLRD